MSDYIERKVVDNYKDHPQHFNYDEKCSECYKNVREFDGDGSNEDMVKIEKEIDDKFIQVTEEEWEQCKQDKLRAEADDAIRSEDKE